MSLFSLDLIVMWRRMVSKSGGTDRNARQAVSIYRSNCIQQRTSALSFLSAHLFKPVSSATSTISNQPPSLLWSALLKQQTAVDSPTEMPCHAIPPSTASLSVEMVVLACSEHRLLSCTNTYAPQTTQVLYLRLM